MNCIPSVLLPVPGAPSTRVAVPRGSPPRSISSRPGTPVVTRSIAIKPSPPRVAQRWLAHTPDNVIDGFDPKLAVIASQDKPVDQLADIGIGRQRVYSEIVEIGRLQDACIDQLAQFRLDGSHIAPGVARDAVGGIRRMWI